MTRCPTWPRGSLRATAARPDWTPIGGTSVASPIVASMFALAGGSHGVAYPAQTLYSHLGSGLVHDISRRGQRRVRRLLWRWLQRLDGSALAGRLRQGALICNAAAGYDGPSGVGTPDGIEAFAPARTQHAWRRLSRSAAHRSMRRTDSAPRKRRRAARSTRTSMRRPATTSPTTRAQLPWGQGNGARA